MPNRKGAPVPAAPVVVEVVPDEGFRGSRVVPCVDCKARAGGPCRKPSGHPMMTMGPGGRRVEEFHAARKRQAALVRIEGLSCEDCGKPDGPGSFVAPVVDTPAAQRLGIVGREICVPCARTYDEPGPTPPTTTGV